MAGVIAADQVNFRWHVLRLS
jgi:hypothetical protein